MKLAGLSFPATEVFVNLGSSRVKRALMGMKVTDPKSGTTYMQDTGVWADEFDKGQIYYFMLGHTVEDFKVTAYVQMIANAIISQ
jgi:type 1 glutamine amidotransferase